jgi:hypothetical protein
MKRNKGNLMVKARELGMPFRGLREQKEDANAGGKLKTGLPREHR